MGYILEFRDEEQYADVMEKAYEAKEALCDLCEALENAGEDKGMSESETEYRGGMYRRGGSYRDGGNYRGGMRRRSGRYGY
jgi:hypothetical protein